MNETRPNKPNILLITVLLLLVLVIGGYFRFTGLNWDDFSADAVTLPLDKIAATIVKEKFSK